MPGAKHADEILARHVGDPVTVVTPKGEVAGVLRSADPQALVLEVGTGDQSASRSCGAMATSRTFGCRRARASTSRAGVAARDEEAGKHTVEVTYRADGLSWGADYLAIFDEAQKTIDFSAWATLRNATGTRRSTAPSSRWSAAAPRAGQPVPALRPRCRARPTPSTRYTVPTPVHVGNGESVQVELMPPRLAAKARSVVTYEAMHDLSAELSGVPGDRLHACSTASVPGAQHAEVAVEIDVARREAAPRRQGARVPPPGEVTRAPRGAQRRAARASSGVARIRLASHNELTGERPASACNIDERAHTITEKIEVKLENKAKGAADVVVREFMWRYRSGRSIRPTRAPRVEGGRAGAGVPRQRSRRRQEVADVHVVYTYP